MSDAGESMTVRGELQESLHVPISTDLRSMGGTLYGLTHFDQLFAARQLVAMVTFSDLVNDARERIWRDAMDCGYADDDASLDDDGTGARAYAEAVSVYLAIANSKAANMWSTLCFWMNDRGAMRETFARQAVPMVWDAAEANPFSCSGGNYLHFVSRGAMVIEFATTDLVAQAFSADAQLRCLSDSCFISTDPPYYDNIGYADLSDFFYIWLRRSLRLVYPSLFETVAVPKTEELVAAPYRHGSKRHAETFFRDGMAQVLSNLAAIVHPSAPITIYYAFKQFEFKSDGAASRGWEAFMRAMIDSGLMITAAWPIHCEGPSRLNALQVNSLSAAVVFVCRRRPENAETITRHQFIRQLDQLIPQAIDRMTSLGGYPNEENQEVSGQQ